MAPRILGLDGLDLLHDRNYTCGSLQGHSSAELDARQGPSSSLQAYSAVEAGTT